MIRVTSRLESRRTIVLRALLLATALLASVALAGCGGSGEGDWSNTELSQARAVAINAFHSDTALTEAVGKDFDVEVVYSGRRYTVVRVTSGKTESAGTPVEVVVDMQAMKAAGAALAEKAQ